MTIQNLELNWVKVSYVALWKYIGTKEITILQKCVLWHFTVSCKSAFSEYLWNMILKNVHFIGITKVTPCDVIFCYIPILWWLRENNCRLRCRHRYLFNGISKLNIQKFQKSLIQTWNFQSTVKLEAKGEDNVTHNWIVECFM